MAQLTVYVDANTRKRIELAAKLANTSVSRWIQERLCSALKTEWPTGYFELLGALNGASIERPTQLQFEDDTIREST